MIHNHRYTALLLGIAGVFVLVGAWTLHLTSPTPALTPFRLAVLVGGWACAWGGAFALLRARRPEAELLLLPPAALLSGWGLLLLARLAPAFLLRQIGWLWLGVGLLCGTALWSTLPRLLRRYRYSLLVFSLALLATTLVFGINPSGVGQRLWLNLMGFYFQPSELLKLILIIYLAAYLADRCEIPYTLALHSRANLRLWWAALLPMLAMVGLALLLLGWQQDLGAALLFYFTSLALLYLAWGKNSHAALGLLLFVPIGIVGYLLSARVALRVSIWLDPWSPAQADRAFQILQSLYAMGAGGLFGAGPGLGYPGFIPAVHTDFVYAALTEEYGLLGALALLLLLAWIIQRGLRLAQRLQSPFESLLAGGIAALFGIQTWVIVAGNIKQIPITGVTLPLLSYGGSSLITSLIAIGLLLNISAPHAPALSLPLAPDNHQNFKPHVQRLGRALLLLLALSGIGTGWWSFIHKTRLDTYPSNPRRVIAEMRIQHGPILDRYGIPLADITINPRGFVERTYPVPEAAAVVGYTTLQYGADGIQATCAATLRGDSDNTPREALWDDLLHHAPVGLPVRLTLDANLQRAAQQALTAQPGAIVLVDAHNGEILALASAPIYPSAEVAEQWGELRDNPQSPLLNRATQGLAQPGGSLQTVLLGITLQNGSLRAPATPLTASVPVDGVSIAPLGKPPAQGDWSTALAHSAPAPFYALGEQLGPEQLIAGFETWGLTDALPFALPNVTAPWPPDSLAAGLEAIGQGELLVTPLQMVGVAASLGNAGVRPPLHLLMTPQPGCTIPEPPEALRVASPEVAESLLRTWPRYSTGAGHLSIALAGPERTLVWYLGVNSPDAPRYAIVVLLENPARPDIAAQIGVQLLELAVGP